MDGAGREPNSKCGGGDLWRNLIHTESAAKRSRSLRGHPLSNSTACHSLVCHVVSLSFERTRRWRGVSERAGKEALISRTPPAVRLFEPLVSLLSGTYVVDYD
jgi:hypothetical protein